MIRKQFRKLKKGAKRVFAGLVILCLVSTGSGIGSLFVHADEYEDHVHNLSVSDNGDGTHTISCAEEGCRDYPVTEGHEYNSEGVCLVCGSTDPSFGSSDQGAPADQRNTHNGTDTGDGQGSDETTGTDETSGGDAGSDSNTDSGTDTNTDTDTNSDTDTGADTNTNGDTNTDENKGSDSNSDTNTDAGDGSDTNANSDSDNDTNSDSDANNGIGDNTDSGSDSNTNADDNADSNANSDSNANTNTDPDSNSDTDSNVNSEANTNTDNSQSDGQDGSSTNDGANDSQSATEPEDENTQNDNDAAQDPDETDTLSDTTLDSATLADEDDEDDEESTTLKNAAASFSETQIIFTPVQGVNFDDDGNIDYATSSVDFLSNPFNLYYNGTELTEGTDYTSDINQLSIPHAPECGSTYTITFTGIGSYSGTLTKTIAVNDVALTYDGSSEKETSYSGSVSLAAPGYTLCFSEDGSFTTPLVYTIPGITSPTVYLMNDNTGKKIQCIVPAIAIGDHAFNEFFDPPLEVNTNLVYTAEPQLILKNIADPVVGATGVDSVKRNTDIESFYFKDAISDISATYEIEYSVSGVTTTLSKTFTTSIKPRDLSDEDVYVLVDANALYDGKIDYSKVTSYSDILSISYKKPSGDSYELVEGIDYEIVAPGISDPAVASLEDVYKLRINGKGNFTGQIEKDVIVSPIGVTFNGALEKKSLYIKEVTIKPVSEDFTIALDSKDAFDNYVVYNKTGKNQLITLYLKNKNSGKVIMQKASEVSISYPELLFDGKPTMDNYYEGSVNLSAYDFKVTRVVEKDEKETKVNGEYYLRSTVGTGQNFTIYFMDSTGADNITEVPIEVKGLDIYEGIDIEVLYNGESYQKWFNKTVKITAPGYMISKHGKNKYSKTYKVSKEGKNSVSLDFKNSYTVKNYTLEINIDKHAPTGKITVGDYSSKKYKEKDATGFVTVNAYPIKITYDDELSGKDYVKYYISEKFYSSISEAQEATKSDATAWKTYSSKNKPTLSVDKKNYIYAVLYDKAGNTTAISTDALICDTILPTIVSATVAKDQSGNLIAAIGGQDKLGGIEYFRLLYREKDPDNVAAQYEKPSKTDVESKGVNIEVKDSKDGVFLGVGTLTGIDLTKEYDYFAVAVDNAGNISEVSKADIDAKLSAEIEKAAKEKKGQTSGGLTPAANGIAGGGSGDSGGAGGAGAAGGAAGGQGAGASGESGKGSGSSDKTSGAGSGTASDTIAEREIRRDPYISNATGSTKIGEIETSGWNNIIAEIKKADHGSYIEVEMSGLSVIPKELLQALKMRDDLLLKLKMSDDVVWELRGSDIYTDSFVDTDLGVVIGSNNIPNKLLNEIVEVYPHIEFATKTTGDLGFTATLFVPVNASNSGMNATLYYYNAEDKELVVNDTVKVGDDGYARYKMSHCSDYSVVVSPVSLVTDEKKKTAEEEMLITTAALENEDEEVFSSKKVRLTDVLSVPGLGRIWLFAIAIISGVLCVAILMIPGFKQDDFEE